MVNHLNDVGFFANANSAAGNSVQVGSRLNNTFRVPSEAAAISGVSYTWRADQGGDVLVWRGTYTDATPDTISRDEILFSIISGAAGASDFDLTTAAQIREVVVAQDFGGKGADIASASPLVVGQNGNFFDVTGTTGFSAMTVAAGTFFMLQFDGILTMTHGASLSLPQGIDITTEAGDTGIFFATAANTVICLSYTSKIPEVITLVCSDETSDLEVLADVITYTMPFAMTLTAIFAVVTTAPTGASLIVDVNDGGSTIMTTNKLEIEATEKSTETAATAPTLTDTALADRAVITVDIDQIGSTVAGAGLKVYLIGHRTNS